ncbi:aspartate aminotransferase family protein [Robiginitalea biformata]|uniref:Putative acetylornithine aminotransferase n=1 Tax=Robiginitalea biformata (strain ATCC BAA-864 / DSM 15991 / KCTC 12146 / HTCC2501) TaxID=313596 RepID=A4CJ58_ROBBH|nr:aminotransferase class III-fold pyridoxal phosphate-dependent enzyme [Robiginitalea biformata]EAR16966.1 putative acetylornithine aminotransferase [Robiginitalea biformata HTCC2501]
MELFDVYPLYDITPIEALGSWLTDNNGQKYLDLYGGHAVISIGHSHPRYVERIGRQLQKIGFYSNSVQNPLQQRLADRLGSLSGCGDYRLFLCNSGAEANENALKLASFHTGHSRVIAFHNSFHGRTSAAVAATDNPGIVAPLNANHEVVFLPLNRTDLLEHELEKGGVCAVILEGIQGVGGLDSTSPEFYGAASRLCDSHGAVLIADEVQCGFGRSGKFFAYQHSGARPGIISMAKGMGNGFPVGGILIREDIRASHGLLGTTFGGNHLACAAVTAVLEVIESEDLLAHARGMEAYFRERAGEIPEIREVKGKGLMLGLRFDFEVADLRKKLIFEHRIFTGSAKNKNLLRILPALNVQPEELDLLFAALKKELA